MPTKRRVVMISSKRLYITFCCFLCLLYSSCGNKVVYTHFMPVTDKIWQKKNTFFFNVDITNNTVPYNISIQLRHNDDYPYSNLWLLCEMKHEKQTITDSLTVYEFVAVKDTVECMLADEFGKWLGRGLTLFQRQIELHEHYYFPDTGRYVIGVRHGMRDDQLKGFENVGLRIEAVK